MQLIRDKSSQMISLRDVLQNIFEIWISKNAAVVVVLGSLIIFEKT